MLQVLHCKLEKQYSYLYYNDNIDLPVILNLDKILLSKIIFKNVDILASMFHVYAC